jgi:molybdopterin-guanine dinucleotide biosynthesis protein B
MRPIISFVGKSDSGKTTILEKLIAELKRRGYAVVTVKHSGEAIELDKTGKNSWRFSQAGSDVVAVSTKNELAIIKQTDHDLSPQEIARTLRWDYDIMLTEGFKSANTYKVEVHVKAQGTELLTPPQQLLAVVSDEPVDVDVPQFTRNDIGKIADLVESKIKTQEKEADIELFINGNYVPMKQFVKDWMSSVILAMASNLNEVGEIKSLDISLRRKV